MALVCPCGRVDARRAAFTFEHCCGRYIGHFDETPAPDAESLMRSRYTAYGLGDEAYILATWHASTRPSSAAYDPATKWLGLEVKSHRQVDDFHAEVEFVARYRVAGKGARLRERSRFVREEERGRLRWFYVDGEMR
jgi:SEC-C motif-containing protein